MVKDLCAKIESGVLMEKYEGLIGIKKIIEVKFQKSRNECEEFLAGFLSENMLDKYISFLDS